MAPCYVYPKPKPVAYDTDAIDQSAPCQCQRSVTTVFSHGLVTTWFSYRSGTGSVTAMFSVQIFTAMLSPVIRPFKVI